LGESEFQVLLGFSKHTQEYNHPTLASQAGLFVVLNSYNYDLKYNLPVWKGIEATFGVNGMYQTNTVKRLLIFRYRISFI